MKESILKTDKNLIFRETFGSEDLVRANGGLPTGVTFSNGNGSFLLSSASRIFYNKIFSGTGSVRIKCKPTSFATLQLLFDFRDNTASPSGAHGYLNATTGQIVYAAGGTIYNRGIPSTTSYLNSDNDIVITGISLSNLRFAIGSNYATLFNFTGNFELLEIYQGTLTADEVKNLYENRQNREISNHLEQLDTTTNASFAVSASLPPDTFVTSGNNVTSVISDGSATAGFYSTIKASDGSVGDFYRVRFTAVRNSGNLTFVLAQTPDVISGAVSDNYLMNASGDYDFYIRRSSTSSGYPTFFNATAYNWSITNFRINKVVVNPISEILRVDARNGVISNKYSGNQYTELVTNGSFDTDTTWSKGTGWSIANGVATKVAGSAANLSQPATSASKLYRVIFTISNYSAGTINAQLSGGGGGTGTSRSANGTYIEDITSGSTAGGNFYLVASSTFAGDIDNVSVKEIIPTITNTSVTTQKSGPIYAMDFNGTTSKIDCGSYDGLTGNKTLIAWLKPRTSGENDYGGIIDKDSFSCNLASTGAVRFTRNSYSTSSFSATGGIKFHNWNFLVITSTSTGITNFYINGVLSGTANQSAGTPAANSNQITIGNRSNSDRTFDGGQSNVRIVDGILSTQEIAQLYQSEKTNYGL